MKENNYIKCKNFINQYIDKIIVYKDKVEVTFKVASAIFNASFPDDKSGMLKIIIEISRTELKTLIILYHCKELYTKMTRNICSRKCKEFKRSVETTSNT